MQKSLLAPLQRSIKAKLVVGTAAIVLGVVCTLTFVMARNAANLLHREALNQLAQVLDQSVDLLAGFLEVRDANLDVWVANPLPKAVVSDPALGSVFVPSLRDYFAKFKAKEPWIETIYLLKDGAVVYDDAEAFTLMEKTDGSPGGVQRLLALAPSGLTVMNLTVLTPTLDRYVIAMKRPLLEEGAPIEGGFLVLLLNLDIIQQKLFGPITIGKNGFLSVVARLSEGGAGAIWFPAPPTTKPERVDFVAASQQGRLLPDGPAYYRSIMLDHRRLEQSPLAIVGVASLNDVRQPVTRLISTSVLFGSLALLLGVGGAFVVSQRLCTPIRELTAKARQFAAGERRGPGHDTTAQAEASLTSAPAASMPGAPVPVVTIRSRDEVGELASAFNQMAADISRLIDDLEDYNHTLEHRVAERTAQLAEANAEITALNDQLKAENLRLGAELDVARRLQKMVLPTATELQGIDALDIAGYMEAADEVGGDYYDLTLTDFCSVQATRSRSSSSMTDGPWSFSFK